MQYRAVKTFLFCDFSVHVPVAVNCLSFYGCQTMNYALLKFLDVNMVNVFARFTCLLYSS